MTAFWDSIRKEVTEACSLDDTSFVDTVIDIETRVIEAVSLVTGDREFPEDLREKIIGVIGLHSIDFGRYIWRRANRQNIVAIIADATACANARARQWLLTMRYSIMLEELHAVFHLVAARRIPNRYDTYFTDDPSSFLRAREAALV